MVSLSSAESGANRFGVKKSFEFLGITIGGDCDGEVEGEDRVRLFTLLSVLFLPGTILFFTILIVDTVGIGFGI